MPAEVISLLSSSPTPPTRVTSNSSRPRAQNIPSRALDYGDHDLTGEPSTGSSRKGPNRQPDKPATGTKRSGGHSRYNDDFLFLSDDFDTTGDLDRNITKKPRLSPSGKASRGKTDSGFSRTKSAVANLEARSRSPSALKRCNSVVDPIEHSSSPNSFATSKPLIKARDDFSDVFETSTGKQTAKSQPLDILSDPFASSPVQNLNSYRPPVHSSKARLPVSDEPLESWSNNKPSKVPVVIDLSDDEHENATENSSSKEPKSKAAAWDPISSSMPERRATDKDLEDSDLDSDADLPDLGDIDFSKVKSKRRAYSLSSSPPPRQSKAPKGKEPMSKKASSAPKKTTEEKEQERRERAEAREAEKERKRAEKEKAKEQRAIERQTEKALAEVNKVKTHRKVAAPEMIVDLPTTLGVGIRAHIEKFLSDVRVQFEYHDSPVDNVVRWRRRVNSEYDKEEGRQEPVPMYIKKEDHVLVMVTAADFVKLVLGAEGQDLEAHISILKTCFPGVTLIFLVEGLMPWMRKNKNILNRRFVSAVRAADVGGNSGSTSSQTRRRNNAQQEYIDEDIVEDALLSLQVVHGAIIHHTNAQVETAEWVAVFTEHISTRPYRKIEEAENDTGFCMASGQRRTGEDAKDTYVRMLQEVNRVTAPIAHGIIARYGNVGELVRGLERDGPLALENCRKSSNKDGAFTERAVGQAISKRIYKIFTSRDPRSMDV
ncbi:ERCC4 domain-containing protein [Hypoxylon sp. FL1284]|nr:ERCC4 domain-containing protein [Hypoxylon sp. FL1284]